MCLLMLRVCVMMSVQVVEGECWFVVSEILKFCWHGVGVRVESDRWVLSFVCVC